MRQFVPKSTRSSRKMPGSFRKPTSPSHKSTVLSGTSPVRSAKSCVRLANQPKSASSFRKHTLVLQIARFVSRNPPPIAQITSSTRKPNAHLVPKNHSQTTTRSEIQPFVSQTALRFAKHQLMRPFVSQSTRSFRKTPSSFRKIRPSSSQPKRSFRNVAVPSANPYPSSACSKSASKSSQFSIPSESRTKPSPMHAWSRSFLDQAECVVLRG